MIIDAHTHIGSGGAIIARAESLLQSMDAARIDRSLVFAGHINECPTERMLEAIAKYPDRLHGVGAVSPLKGEAFNPRLNEIDRLLANGALVALKFYLGYEHFYPHDMIIDPYLDLLEKNGRPAIFHTGNCYSKVGGALAKYARPMEIDDLAIRRPNLKIILAHMGNPWIIDAAEMCYKNANVYADCSGFVEHAFNDASRKHFRGALGYFLDYVGSPDKLLFGTDWPIATQQDYRAVMRGLRFDAATREKIMHQNAAKLFGIHC